MRPSEIHARRELKLGGYITKKSDKYERRIRDCVLELVRVFGGQGHSGCSAAITLHLFGRLARFDNLSPLTCDPKEWRLIPEEHIGRPGVYQSVRKSDAFSEDNLKTYYIVGEKPKRRRKLREPRK